MDGLPVVDAVDVHSKSDSINTAVEQPELVVEVLVEVLVAMYRGSVCVLQGRMRRGGACRSRRHCAQVSLRHDF